MAALSGTTEGKYETAYAGEKANLISHISESDKFVARAQDPNLSPTARRAAMSMLTGTNVGKFDMAAIAERNYDIQKQEVSSQLEQNPIVSTGSIAIPSIVEIPEGERKDYSKESFQTEKNIVDKIFGDDWTSAGETYTEFMSTSPDDILKQYAVTNTAGRHFTLNLLPNDKYELRSWTGGIRSSGNTGTNYDNLKREFTRLNIPYESGGSVLTGKMVVVSEYDKFPDLLTAATLKAKILSTGYDNTNLQQQHTAPTNAESSKPAGKYDILKINKSLTELPAFDPNNIDWGDPEINQAYKENRAAYDPQKGLHVIFNQPFENQEYSSKDYSSFTQSAGAIGTKTQQITDALTAQIDKSNPAVFQPNKPLENWLSGWLLKSGISLTGGFISTAAYVPAVVETSKKVYDTQGATSTVRTFETAINTGIDSQLQGMMNDPEGALGQLVVGAALFGGAGAAMKASPVKFSRLTAEFPGGQSYHAVGILKKSGPAETFKTIVGYSRTDSPTIFIRTPGVNIKKAIPKDAYLPVNPFETKIMTKSVGPEAPKISLALDVRRITQKSNLNLNEVTPVVRDVVEGHNIPNAQAVTDAIVKKFRTEEVELYGSTIQHGIGKELGKTGLNRIPRDFDIHVGDTTKFDFEITDIINKAAGKDVVVTEKFTNPKTGEITTKGVKTKTGEKLFDTHSKAEYSDMPVETEYLGYGLKSEPLSKTKDGTYTIRLSEQASRKVRGAMQIRGNPETLKTPLSPEVTGRVVPEHKGRIKDIGDFYFAEKLNIAKMELSPLQRIKAGVADRKLENWLNQWGDEIGVYVRSQYNRGVESGELKIPLADFSSSPGRYAATGKGFFNVGNALTFSSLLTGKHSAPSSKAYPVDYPASPGRYAATGKGFFNVGNALTFSSLLTGKHSAPSSKAYPVDYPASPGKASQTNIFGSSPGKESSPSQQTQYRVKTVPQLLEQYKIRNTLIPPKKNSDLLSTGINYPKEPTTRKSSNLAVPPYTPKTTKTNLLDFQYYPDSIRRTTNTTPKPILRLSSKKPRKKKDSIFDIWQTQNVEIPIVRGQEALTGRYNPLELPANKKTFLDLNAGNVFNITGKEKKTIKAIKRKSKSKRS